MYLVSIPEGRVLWSFNTPTPISFLEVSDNGSYVLATGSSPQTTEVDNPSSVVYLFNPQGQLLWNLTTISSFDSVGLSANGSAVALLYGNSLVYMSIDHSVLWNYTLPVLAIGVMRSNDGSSVLVGDSEPNFVNGTSVGSELLCFDSDGESLWNYTIPGQIEDFGMSSSGTYVAAVMSSASGDNVLISAEMERCSGNIRLTVPVT